MGVSALVTVVSVVPGVLCLIHKKGINKHILSGKMNEQI